jgi:hypothetical protein
MTVKKGAAVALPGMTAGKVRGVMIQSDQA